MSSDRNKSWRKIYFAEWYRTNKTRQAKYAKQYYRRNRKKILARVARYRKANSRKRSEYAHFYQMKRKYGLTPEQYFEMLDKQQHACAICKHKTTLVVDHDHDTGKVRGLICRPCNSSIARYERHRKAFHDYLGSKEL